MATHSSILAWEISWTEEPGGATVHGVEKSWTGISTAPIHIFVSLQPFATLRNI